MYTLVKFCFHFFPLFYIMITYAYHSMHLLFINIVFFFTVFSCFLTVYHGSPTPSAILQHVHLWSSWHTFVLHHSFVVLLLSLPVTGVHFCLISFPYCLHSFTSFLHCFPSFYIMFTFAHHHILLFFKLQLSSFVIFLPSRLCTIALPRLQNAKRLFSIACHLYQIHQHQPSTSVVIVRLHFVHLCMASFWLGITYPAFC